MSSRPYSIALPLAFTLSFAACACSSSAGSGELGAGGGSSGSVSGGGTGGTVATIAGASGSSVTPQGGTASGGAGAGSAGVGVGGASGSAGNDAITGGTAGSSAGGANGGSAGANGGSANGGSANGGSANGGSANGGSANGGSSGASPVTFPAQCTCMNLGPPTCVATGHVTYTLTKAAAPTADQQKAYDAITCAMQGAIAYYDCNTSITKQLSVTYNTDVPTADGNYNGAIRFGGSQYMECVTAMHEIAHTVGVGTAPKWPTYSVGGVFTGTNAIAQLRQITGNAADVLHSDTQHFWPYGLNYTSEATSTKDLIDHCEMVSAIRKDLGLQ